MVFRDRQSANENPIGIHRADPSPIGIRYRLMQNLASMTEPVIVQTDHGNAAFKIESARRGMLEVLVIRDLAGSDRCLIPGPQASPATFTDILGADGLEVARVTRTPISAVRDRFEVDILPNDFWTVIGDAGSREYSLDSPNGQVAEVSKRWFLRPDTFGVEVIPGHDDALVLAVATAIDLMAHGFDR